LNCKIGEEEAMHKNKKAYLIFSIVFWLLIATGVILFAVSLGRVHINKFGLLRNYYSSWISDDIYISGLYHIGVGNYFVEFPSSKIYLPSLKINVTNMDLNVQQLTYTLVYRLSQSQIKNLYQSLSTFYEDKIISTVNVPLCIY
jgi:DMSO reductase anchor subunit